MIPAWRLPGKPLVLVGVAASALLLGAGVAVAATDTGSGSQAASSSTPARNAAATPVPVPPSAKPHQIPVPRKLPFPPRFAIPPRLGMPVLGAPFGALHGQFVVPKSGGGYQTVDVQHGTVTAVSTSSITVKSADGYTKSYQITSSTNVDAQRDGIASVKTGQQVSVSATVSGSTATATSIIDSSALPRPGFEVRPPTMRP